MASVYPGALDTFATSRSDSTPMATTHAADHNNANDAINKIEAELGTDPAPTAFATVKACLDALYAAPYVTTLSTVNVGNESPFSTMVGRMAFGSFPAAGTAGRLYTDSTTGTMYRDSGSAWEAVAPPIAATYVTTTAEATLTNEATLDSVIARGTAGTRPSASIAGRLYHATDTNVLSRDNGSTWDDIGVVLGGTAQTWSITNFTTDRTLNQDSFTLNELGDAFGTLIGDLRNRGIVL